MKELISLFESDIASENFTKKEKLLYGLVYPLALTAVALLIGALE